MNSTTTPPQHSDEDPRCTLLYCCHGRLTAGHSTDNEAGDDGWLDEIIVAHNKRMQAATNNSSGAGVISGCAVTKQAILAELKKREATARLDELKSFIEPNNKYGRDSSYSRVPFYVIEERDYLDRRAQLHKEQPDTTPCMCNHNPETGLRLDIVCPVHDSPASP